MGKKAGILFGVIILIAIAVAVLWKPHGDEGPIYNGRSLKYWVDRLPANANIPGIMWAPLVQQKTPDEIEAETAVRAVGSNAIPFLMAQMRSRRQVLSDAFESAKNGAAAILFQRAVLRRQVLRRGSSSGRSASQQDHWEGANGLRVLGPLAKSTIPELVKMMKAGDVRCADAAYAIAAMGPEGEAALTNLMSTNSRTEWVTGCAEWALGQTPTNATDAVPQLISMLKAQNSLIQMGAAWSLGEIHTKPELILPALLNELTNAPPAPGPSSHPATIQALRNYGLYSTNSAALYNYLHSTNVQLRIAASNVVQLFNDHEIPEFR